MASHAGQKYVQPRPPFRGTKERHGSSPPNEEWNPRADPCILTYAMMGIYPEVMGRDLVSSDVFQAVAEPRRRAILEFLAAGERPVNDVVDAIRLPQPSVSKHLRVLLDAGLVEARRDGRQMFYRVNAGGLRSIHDWTETFERHWRGQLRRIRQRAESRTRET
jgi:DNA-binding transcriptional ArsR family regulator